MTRIEPELIDLEKHGQLHEVSLVCKISKLIFCRRIFGNYHKINEVSFFPRFGNFRQPYDVATFQQHNEVFNKLKRTLVFLALGYFQKSSATLLIHLFFQNLATTSIDWY